VSRRDDRGDASLELLLEDTPPAAAGVPRREPTEGRALQRGGLFALGAVALAAGAWLARPRPAVPPGAAPEPAEAAAEGGLRWPGAPEPARLAIDFDHHLRSGTLEVWVDDELVLEEPIEGRVTQKVLSFRLRKGSVQETLEVAPGTHEVRVQVSWDGRRRSARVTGVFKAGVTRRLDVSVARLTRELALDWR
jgi:hypothetical protein